MRPALDRPRAGRPTSSIRGSILLRADLALTVGGAGSGVANQGAATVAEATIVGAPVRPANHRAGRGAVDHCGTAGDMPSLAWTGAVHGRAAGCCAGDGAAIPAVRGARGLRTDGRPVGCKLRGRRERGDERLIFDAQGRRGCLRARIRHRWRLHQVESRKGQDESQNQSLHTNLLSRRSFRAIQRSTLPYKAQEFRKRRVPRDRSGDRPRAGGSRGDRQLGQAGVHTRPGRPPFRGTERWTARRGGLGGRVARRSWN